MKVVSNSKTSVENDSLTRASSIRVCMHVLVTASTDARVMRAATALVKAGYTVSLVDIANEENHQSEEDICGVCMKHVVVSRSFLTTRFDKWTLVRIAQVFVRSTLRVIQTPADIYHAHDVSALPACYIAACLRHKPIIFESHEMPLLERPLSDLGRSRRWLHKLLVVLLNHITPRCAGIITVSPPIVEEIRSRYNVAKITLIRNVPEYRAISKSDRLRQYLDLKPEVRIALYQGNLQPNRSLDRLIYAASFLEPDIVIVMMGRDVVSTRSQLEILIDSEGVSDRVKIIPPVPYDELLDWTSSADIGLTIFSPDYSPNIRMTLPNKFFEYLMAGLPVLTSQLEAIVDIINAYDVGQVVDSLAPADIAGAINKMLEDRAALARMHHKALDAAKNEFYWEKECLQLINLYHKIMEAQNTKYKLQVSSPEKQSIANVQK